MDEHSWKAGYDKSMLVNLLAGEVADVRLWQWQCCPAWARSIFICLQRRLSGCDALPDGRLGQMHAALISFAAMLLDAELSLAGLQMLQRGSTMIGYELSSMHELC